MFRKRDDDDGDEERMRRVLFMQNEERLRRILLMLRIALVGASIALIALQIAQILSGAPIGSPKFAAISTALAWAITLAHAFPGSGLGAEISGNR